jgi:transcriptional regulator with XRE-family HTH domain
VSMHAITNVYVLAESATILPMDWRDRLLVEIKKPRQGRPSGYSLRELSLAAGRGPSYVSELLRGKEPKVANLESVCDVLGTSVSYILTGTDLTRDGEELLRAYTRLGEAERDGLLKMFRAMGASLDAEPTAPAPSPERDKRPQRLRN